MATFLAETCSCLSTYCSELCWRLICFIVVTYCGDILWWHIVVTYCGDRTQGGQMDTIFILPFRLCPTNTLAVSVIYARFALIDTNVISRKCCASCWITITVAVNIQNWPIGCRVQLECDGTRWRTGGEVKGKLANAVGSQYPSHYLRTRCIQHYCRWCAHLGCQ